PRGSGARIPLTAVPGGGRDVPQALPRTLRRRVLPHRGQHHMVSRPLRSGRSRPRGSEVVTVTDRGPAWTATRLHRHSGVRPTTRRRRGIRRATVRSRCTDRVAQTLRADPRLRELSGGRTSVLRGHGRSRGRPPTRTEPIEQHAVTPSNGRPQCRGNGLVSEELSAPRAVPRSAPCSAQ